MRITSLTYRRVRNLGNYQSEALDATADLAPAETPEEALDALRDWVHERLGLRAPSVAPAEPNDEGAAF